MPILRMEHVACNVTEPAAIAAWYVEHLGMRIVRRVDGPPFTHFLADASGAMVIEIYHNPLDEIPAYAAMHPLRFHIGFAADDPYAARMALMNAGATFVEEQYFADGTVLLMMRDPWGLALQLCKRADPLPPAR